MSTVQQPATFLLLCRGDVRLMNYWLEAPLKVTLGQLLPLLLGGSALYGATLGMWHGPEMASYVAIKFPLAVIATLSINALINGIFASLTGSGITIKQSFQFLITGFTIFSIILASLCPVLLFLHLNNAQPGSDGMAQAYRVFLTSNILIITFAGVVSHHLLLRHVRHFANTPRTGTLTFFSWLAMNLFVGAEIMHKLRPFFGAPKLKVEFLREEMLERNFYESFYHVLRFLF